MLDYTNIEFQERLETITNLLKSEQGWGDAYDSSTGQTLIQLMVHATDELTYMLQRRTTETYLETAQLRSSVIARACELGYRFKRASANSGYIEVTLDYPTTTDIIIPIFSEVTSNGVSYVTAEETIIPANTTVKSIFVKQAAVKTDYYDIDADNKFTVVDYEYIDNTKFYIYSGATEYYDVRDITLGNKAAISFLDSTDAYYDIKYTNSGMCVIFGDGISGMKPDQQVQMIYLQVDTESEPLNILNAEFEFTVPLISFGGIEVPYTCVNTTRINSLTLPEDNISIKKNATDYHRTNNRANTNTDYAYWARNIPDVNIKDASAVGEVELDSILYNLNNVYLTYIKADGSTLTTEEKQRVYDFFDNIKTSQAHIVLQNAKQLAIKATLDVKRNPKLPIANSELYDILRKFMADFFVIGEGALGRDLQRSDFIDELYAQSITRNGVTYQLIDYCNFGMDGVYALSYPPKSRSVTVNVESSYVPATGNTFVIICGNIVCAVDVLTADDFTILFQRMVDKINEVTPYSASIVLGNVVLDAFGNPVTVEIVNNVGSVLLIGVDTPYFSNDSMISDVAIGSTTAKVVNNSGAVDVNHYYYSSLAGRRPMIPLRVGTRVRFTAPSDTSVKVYTRLNKDLPATEVLVTTLAANQAYDQTFTTEHVVIFEYLANSSEDRVAIINYPQFDGAATGIKIESVGVSGEFDVTLTSGDLSTYSSATYSIQLPVEKQTDTLYGTVEPVVSIGSVSILNSLNNTVYTVDNAGVIIDFVTGLPTDGKLDYYTGIMDLPTDMPTADYKIVYDHNTFDNFFIDKDTVAVLIEPKQYYTDTVETLSTINIRK